MKSYLIVSLFAVLSLVLAASSPASAASQSTQGKSMTMKQHTPEPTQTIVEIAAADGRFTTLVTAVQAAGLVETLSGEGPFTVFAPTDDAFAALPEGTLEKLLEDPEGDLKDTLLYHVVPGKYMAEDVVKKNRLETALGEKVKIDVEGKRVFIDNARVIITDIEASNGVIHVIDSVLLPPEE